MGPFFNGIDFFSQILLSLSPFLQVYSIEITKSFSFNSPLMSMKFWNDFYLLFKLCMFIYFSCLLWYCRSVLVWNSNKNGSFVSQIGLSYPNKIYDYLPFICTSSHLKMSKCELIWFESSQFPTVGLIRKSIVILCKNQSTIICL